MRPNGPHQRGGFPQWPQQQQQQQPPYFSPSVMSCLPAGMQFQPLPPSADQASRYFGQHEQSRGVRPPQGFQGRPVRPPFPVPSSVMMVPPQMAWTPMMVGPPHQGGFLPPPSGNVHPHGRSYLPTAPPMKRQKKGKEAVPAVEKLTVDPVVREPQTAAEREEVARWIAERKRHFPTSENVARKEEERKSKEATLREERQRRLCEVLAVQEQMGLTKQAGTAELAARLGGRGGGRGRGRGTGRQGRGYRSYPAAGSNAGPPATEDGTSVDQAQPQATYARGLPLLAGYESDQKSDAHASAVDEKAALGSTGTEILMSSSHAPIREGQTAHQQQEGTATRFAREREQYRRQQEDYALRKKGRQPRTPHNNSAATRPASPRPKRKVGLLEKLLAKDIRQDQEYLLQAIRFLVRNNFLLDVEDDSGVDKLWYPENATGGERDDKDATQSSSLASDFSSDGESESSSSSESSEEDGEGSESDD